MNIKSDDNKRKGWSARDVFIFGLHALDHGCRTSTGPGQAWVSIRHDLGDCTRSVSFCHDGTAYVTTVSHRTWATTEKRWLDWHTTNIAEWCAYLAIPAPEEKAP